MALPKHTGPGALTRKECGYTAPSREELREIRRANGTLSNG